MAIEGENERATAPGNAWRSEPASSILASRFVPHLATQGNESHLTRETFAQLRQELLSEIQSQLRVDEDVTDINKLICIVLKAGLELNPNRSASEQDLEGQVLDCLDIIQASIEKAPQALWELSDPLILGEDIHAPLFAWLILRLIRLATTWSSETVQEKIQLLCASLAYSQFKQARSLPASYAVAAFLRACTSGPFMAPDDIEDCVKLTFARYFVLSRNISTEQFLGYPPRRVVDTRSKWIAY